MVETKKILIASLSGIFAVFTGLTQLPVPKQVEVDGFGYARFGSDDPPEGQAHIVVRSQDGIVDFYADEQKVETIRNARLGEDGTSLRVAYRAPVISSLDVRKLFPNHTYPAQSVDLIIPIVK